MLLFVSIFLSVGAAVAQRAVTGTVTEEDGTPLIGVSIAVKGGTPIAVTDFDGKYSAQVKDGDILVFGYLGMQSKEVKVSGPVLNVVLAPESNTITELVVTAMGVSQEKKKMNFAVQALGAEDLTANKSTNFVESLRGKISGVNFASTGGSPNGASQMIIRGISSINTTMNNEPLFVIDGMQVSGGASSMAAINPNDIENVTVLKGAAASALYGQEGANGVVMVTTKSGAKGKLTVSASASFQVDQVARVPERQSMYAPGVQGVLKDRSLMNGWGPYLFQGEQTYNNADDYFKTGILQKYDASVTGGSDKFSTYASISYQKHDGIIINDYSNRVGFLLKNSFDVSPTVNLSFVANISNAESRDADGAIDNIYSWGINQNMADYSSRWLYSNEDADQNEKKDNTLNPYWKRYNDGQKSESTRNLLQASGTWKALKGLSLNGRLGYDTSSSATNEYMMPRYKRSELTEEEQAVFAGALEYFGRYEAASSRSSAFSAQAMATYRAEITDDWSLEAMFGTESRINKGFSSTLIGKEFDDTGTISYNTTLFRDDTNSKVNRRQYKKFGFFGELRLDYKGVLQASGTLRNDQTSTLQPGNRSYLYSSITGGLIFSELFKIRSDVFDYGKLRGNWAQVGKSPSPYLFGQKFKQKTTFPDGGIGVDPTLTIADDGLQPEMTTSWEIGADLRFFKGKTTFDIAYYSTEVKDQIVNVRVSPAAGKIQMTRNEGNIENSGLEFSLGQEIISTKDFSWSAILNFSLNRGKVIYLPNDLVETTSIQIGDTYGTAFVGGSTTAISGKDYLRTPDGKVICDENGYPQINPAKTVNIGDREPDFISGLSNTLRYKDFGLSFLIDFRKGGDVYNATGRSLWNNGQHKRWETYRNREIIFDGVVKQGNTYVPNTKAVVMDQLYFTNYIGSVSSNFVEDGSFVRLSYVTLSYDLSKYVKKSPIKGLNLSFTGRNLLLLTKYSGSDPEINQGATGGSGSMGFDNMNVPKTRSFNVSLNATF